MGRGQDTVASFARGRYSPLYGAHPIRRQPESDEMKVETTVLIGGYYFAFGSSAGRPAIQMWVKNEFGRLKMLGEEEFSHWPLMIAQTNRREADGYWLYEHELRSDDAEELRTWVIGLKGKLPNTG